MPTSIRTKIASGVLASAIGLGGLGIATAPGASAAGVVTTTDTVNIRTGPSTANAIVGRVPRGTPVTVTCYSIGQQIGTDPAWLYVTYGGRTGFISDWYTNTRWRSYAQLEAYGFGRCGATRAPAPAPTSIPGATGAVNWMRSRMGSTAYDGWCLRAVFLAYQSAGRDIGRAPTAYDYWANRPAAQRRGDRNAPYGALVFFDGWYRGERAGHVGISLGNGQYISTYDATGRGIHIGNLAGRSNYLGFITP